MGRALTAAAVSAGDIFIVGATEYPGSPALGKDAGALAGLESIGVSVSDSVETAAARADAWIDFTTPAATLAALHALQGTKVQALIVGTTGLTPAQEAELDDYAASYTIVKSGNFSIGVTLMLDLVTRAAATLGPEFDIEILERHHRRKRDAPSGTALMIGEAAAAGRGARLTDLKAEHVVGLNEVRRAGDIGFAVQRAGGIVGDHEASITSEREMLTIGHRALDRSIFADGALRAARWAVEQPPGKYDMRDVLSLGRTGDDA